VDSKRIQKKGAESETNKLFAAEINKISREKINKIVRDEQELSNNRKVPSTCHTFDGLFAELSTYSLMRTMGDRNRKPGMGQARHHGPSPPGKSATNRLLLTVSSRTKDRPSSALETIISCFFWGFPFWSIPFHAANSFCEVSSRVNQSVCVSIFVDAG
jgi:hypothetical protein